VVTDEQLSTVSVTALIAEGSTAQFRDGVIAAAVQADRLGVQPRALCFLAEIVRRGGTRYAARLPEPLATGEQSALAREWLDAAVAAATDSARFARWLDAVAAVLAARRLSRP
jgi:hypothetical protein